MASDADRRTIALVDDDRNILTSLSIALQAEGFGTRVYTDGEAALKAMAANPPDLAILDVKMPRMDGWTLLARLREASRVPVIFLTSRDEEGDEEHGLGLGADDYVTKPFSQRLLIARVRALLRRSALLVADESGRSETVLVRGELELDPERHRARWRGRDVTMTVSEFLILQALAIRPGLVKSRAQLMDAAYGDDTLVDDRTVDSHIKRIRRKLRDADPEFRHIETLYGVGYRFAEG